MSIAHRPECSTIRAGEASPTRSPPINSFSLLVVNRYVDMVTGERAVLGQPGKMLLDEVGRHAWYPD